MCSKIIKFVAGGGKTTYCLDYLKTHQNGLYLAFNNSVVDKVQEHGFLARTIDSFFQSYIIPKFVNQIPIIGNGSEIKFEENDDIPDRLKGVGNIKIHPDGKIFCKKADTLFTLDTENASLHESTEKHSYALKYIFERNVFHITDTMRSDLSFFILKNYADKVVSFVINRFAYVIFDEAQDLSGYKEKFAELLFESSLDVIVLGDDNQNINGGGDWFEHQTPNERRLESHRCPNDNCDWIRDNLSIDIYGNGKHSCFQNGIEMDNVLSFDNGDVVLLFSGRRGEKQKEIIDNWKGRKETIKKAKGDTIEKDILIIGDSLSKKQYYTAITRTTKNVYSTIKKIND